MLPSKTLGLTTIAWANILARALGGGISRCGGVKELKEERKWVEGGGGVRERGGGISNFLHY